MPGVQSKGLRLLSFDGGGARTLSQVKIMESLIHRIQFDTYPDDPDKVVLPCECLDLIGGSDTGGILAIMFGKLRMSVNEAYEEFDKIRREVYATKLSAKERTDRLRECIEDLLARRGHGIDMKFRGTEGCPCFVMATPKANMQSKTKLRSYVSRSDPSPDITIVDAILATCATQPFFLPLSFGQGITRQELIGGSIGLSNPCYELIVEGRAKFKPSDGVATILSIGSGHLGTITLSDSDDAEQWVDVFRNMITNSEKRAQEMAARLNGTGVYFRFSVEQGLQQHHEASVHDLVWLNTQTQAYLENEEVSERLDSCVETILSRESTISLKELGGLRGSEVGKTTELVASLEREQGKVHVFTSSRLYTNINRIILVIESDMKALDELRPADIKRYSLPDECMDGTRQDILQRVDGWIEDAEARNILWINGYPGVGKSAIASTIVNRLRHRGQLGSSFFFRREDADVSTANALWRSIAFDLAKQYTSVRKQLISKMESDRDILTTANVEELFQQIISEPLESISEISTTRPPVIIIDALDECGGIDGQHSQARKKVLLTLTKWSNLSTRFKIIVTSRREYDMERVLEPISHIVEIHTGSNVSEQSSADIKSYFISRFKPISDQYTSLPSNWPGRDVVDQLTRRAGGLFIWARVVAEFVARGEPKAQLKCIQQGESSGNDMSSLYTQVLNISFPNPRSNVLEAFHSIIGAIVFLKRPLSSISISYLLSIDETSMQYICNNLKPVVKMGVVLQITHQSFVDYLIDSKSCPEPFCIRQEEEEQRLALACLKTMKNGLKFNICGIESSYFLNEDIEDLGTRIRSKISDYLYYSSRYWADHLTVCPESIEIAEYLDDFMKTRLLFWLEILSITKHMNAASHILSILIQWMKSHHQDYSLATDFQQFIRSFASVIAQSIPHIYLSALPFAPSTSLVSKNYKDLYPNSLSIEKGGLEKWPICQNIIHVSEFGTNLVIFSPDGRRILSKSHYDISVHDSETGELVTCLIEVDGGDGKSVAFSPNGKQIYSISGKHQVSIWDVETGNLVSIVDLYCEQYDGWITASTFFPARRLIASVFDAAAIQVYDLETGKLIAGPFEAHNYRLDSVIFSPDGRRIASGSDSTIRIWDLETCELIVGPWDTGAESIRCIAFSPNGNEIASGSSDKTVKVWNAWTGDAISGPFEGHEDEVTSITFSPCGSYIASGSHDTTIRVWDIHTGEASTTPFEGHHVAVRAVAFSPDGRRVASVSSDGKIRVWGAETREPAVGVFQGHTDGVRSIAFSSDKGWIGSGSDDKSISIWNATTGQLVLGPLRGHDDYVQCVCFSPDGRQIASGSRDKKLYVWDTCTGDIITGPLEGHNQAIGSVDFSPDGRYIVSGSNDCTLRVWDTYTGHLILGPLEGHDHGIIYVKFVPMTWRIVSGSKNGAIVWDVEIVQPVAGPFTWKLGPIISIALSPDGRSCVSGSSYGHVWIWDVETGETTKGPFEAQHSYFGALQFSPDGTMVASVSNDSTIKLWSVETGEMIAGLFRGHTDHVPTMVFLSKDRIASASGDKTIRFWELSSSASSLTSPFNDSSERREGWVLDPQSRPLFWVPPELRRGLLRPSNKFIIGNMIKTRLNFDNFVYGEQWTSCRK